VSYTRARRAHKGIAMRILLSPLLLSLLAACGQTGPLYLPDEGIDTEVEIRPGPTPPAETTEPEEQAGEEAGSPTRPEQTTR